MKHMFLSTLFSLIAASSALADEPSLLEKSKLEIEKLSDNAISMGQKSKEKIAETKKVVFGTRTSLDNRKESFLSLLWNPYSFLSVVLPKWGLQIGYVFNEQWSLEPEYQSGSFGWGLAKFDVGKISEKNYLVPARMYIGNSFNFKFGPGYHTLNIDIGDKLLSKLTRQDLHLEIVDISAYVLNLGLGNRFQFDNGITVGADWFDISVPLVTQLNEKASPYFSDANERDKFLKTINLLRNFPSMTIAKIQVGYTF